MPAWPSNGWLTEPGSAEAVSLLDRHLFAPDLLCAECANVLWKKVVRGELSSDEAELAARALETAEIDLIPTRPYLAAATAIAIDLAHPAYDCIYLAVAMGMATPFVTGDQRFIGRIGQRNSRFRDCVVALAEVPQRL